MGRDDVLFDIFNTLHRLETLLEGQESRLKSVELSVRPSNSSAASECSCSFDSDMAASCAEDKHGPRLPPNSPLPPPPSSKSDFPTPEMYQMSVMNLRNRFEFIDDSQPDVREIHQNLPQALLEPEEHAGNPSTSWKENIDGDAASYVGGHDDAYTQSVYSSRPLSSHTAHPFLEIVLKTKTNHPLLLNLPQKAGDPVALRIEIVPLRRETRYPLRS
ncbi:hypothetical protein QBC33DRAFT_582342 [Phialemonium atrogriseum]|uniref:Uncharacterized protein n=1 Tax=Phialemonium atrogriseum TaxID=1093897 RepID=A0AAJ0CAV3_9PEZI|nr:uncharacterized protein QBC33DRAFT_582342 [Phialemonium atrogriseum]KAK1772113.1 hypothetical protein QBC33DRAFT_582342 [Phialemonium atrogriseum]